MARIMTHKEWMKMTYAGVTSRRSSKLKAVDNALLQYEKNNTEANKKSVLVALQTWISSKGSNWKTSVRNKRNAVSNLHRQLTGQGTGKAHSPVALSHIRDESRALITDLFQGKQMVFRPGLMTKLAGNSKFSKISLQMRVTSVAYHSNKVSGGAITRGAKNAIRNASARDRSNAKSLASNLFGEVVPANLSQDVNVLLAGVMPNFMQELTAASMPFVGVVFSGGKTVYNAFKYAHSAYKTETARMHASRTLSCDEPEAAFKSVIRMLERNENHELANCAIGMAEFGSKIASLLADGGTVANSAISLASGLVKLLMLLRLIVRDVQERNEANQIMKKPIITAELFRACPVMGAYFICCAPTSVIVNTILSSDRFYEPGMMDTVERAVKHHIEPLKKRSRELVKKHRMYIPDLQRYPGILEKNKKALKQMLKSKGKSDMQGISSEDYFASLEQA